MQSPAFLFEQASLSDKVRAVRNLRRLRQVDVADAAGVAQAQVSALELGQYVPLSIRRKILRTLGLEAQL